MKEKLEAVRKRLELVMRGKLAPNMKIRKEHGMVAIDVRPVILK